MSSTNPAPPELIAELEALGRPAPAGLRDRVLAATGIADRYTSLPGPLGPVYVAWNDAGVSAVAPDSDDETFAALFSERVGRPLVRDDDMPERLADRVRRALADGKPGTLPLDLTGLTPFQREVLEQTATIPRGELRTYAWVARAIGKPAAVRAVGNALARNPVPLIIPCHRVGRTDGSLGNYAFGTGMKRDLLEHEGLDPNEVEHTAARGVRYVGSDTTHIYCVPTCRNARRIASRHRSEFSSSRAAVDRGYRPCKVCKPVPAA